MTQPQSSTWDLGRFIKTLAYFDVIPFVGCLARLFRGENHSPTNSITPMGAILVTAATSNLGQQIVHKLSEHGYLVRSLVSNLEEGRQLLGEAVGIVVGDLNQRDSLTANLFQNVQAVICIGQEYPAIKNLVQSAAQSLGKAGESILFDFTQPASQLKELWGAVDDVVMGGISQSEIRLSGNSAQFMGTVSTANSGGFASVRTRNLTPTLDLSGYEGIQLRVRGDGNRYKFLLRTEASWDGVAYSYAFDTTPDTWIDVQIPFAEMLPVFRAKTLPTADPLDRGRICSVQLMLSKFEYDGALNPRFQPGFFQLQVAAIAAYRSGHLTQFVLIHPTSTQNSAFVTDEPGSVEDLLRQSGLTYTMIRPCSTTEALEDLAELCVQAIAHPDD